MTKEYAFSKTIVPEEDSNKIYPYLKLAKGIYNILDINPRDIRAGICTREKGKDRLDILSLDRAWILEKREVATMAGRDNCIIDCRGEVPLRIYFEPNRFGKPKKHSITAKPMVCLEADADLEQNNQTYKNISVEIMSQGYEIITR